MKTNTETRERPILFRSEMVRAIPGGRKTQTRRLAKLTAGGHVRLGPRRWHPGDPEAIAACPYGQPGDRLWVREAWCPAVDPITAKIVDGKYHYRADGQEVFLADGDGGITWKKDGSMRSPWRPSIHMPRLASRLVLEITEVRLQRIQAISEEDAKAEGVEAWRDSWNRKEAAEAFIRGTEARLATKDSGTAKRLFYLLWEKINAKRGFGWKANRWVWAITFQVDLPERR